AVELVTPDDILTRMVYAITNPVKDDLVTRTRHWPGVDCLSAIEQGVCLVASTPVRFFRPDNDLLPALVCLDFVRPPASSTWPTRRGSRCCCTRIAAVEDDAAIERTKTGSHVLGRRAVRKQPWRD